MVERRELKDYPPIATFHKPGCWIYGGSATALPVGEARAAFPNHHFDTCAAGEIVPYVTVEENDFGDHLYEPSDKRPADAVRPLCRKCLGTHGGDDGREKITVKEAPKPRPVIRLIIPQGVQADQRASNDPLDRDFTGAYGVGDPPIKEEQ